jgi:class 3 adenylate cyclase/tetratricopeptide (TPR) repeat protein
MARVRQIVSVLFADVADSTSLIEQLGANAAEVILNRFFHEADKVVNRYGGVLQNRIGDEVMALFGVPRPFGDDALRAVLAALDLHEAIATLNPQLRSEWRVELGLRTAVHTDSLEVAEVMPVRVEVITPLTTIGKRLQTAAQAGETLISQATHRLVRDVVRADPIGPIYLKGIEAPLHALRVVGLRARIPTSATPLIGRGQELSLLSWAYDWVVSQKACYLVYVLGEAGVGKTRLVEEYARRIGSRPGTGRLQPQMLRGQCKPYGSYTTYHPFRQILRQAVMIASTDSSEQARAKLSAMVEGDPSVIARLESLLGLTDSPAEPEDTFRALQRALVIMAQRAPVILIIDDLQWAQPPLLELIDRLRRTLASTSILIVCIARLELLDEPRGVDGPNVAFLRMPPLTRPETEQLVGYLLPAGRLDPELTSQIFTATEGYPFAVEELARSLIEEGHLQLQDGRWSLQDGGGLRVTPTVQAALAARVGRLDEVERLILVRAAVVGLEFQRSEVEALLPNLDSGVVTEALQELVRKELLRQPEQRERVPPASSDPSEDTYVFRNVRYQDAAYQRITPQDRADLHERYADWLEQRAGGVARVAERIGFHLERAYRHRLELRRNVVDDTARKLAQRAGRHYAAAGRGYIPQGILPIETAASALDRAIQLLPEHSPDRLQAELDLAEVLQMTAPARSMELYEDVLRTSRSAENHMTQLHAGLGQMELSWFRGDTGDWDRDRRRLGQIIAELAPSGQAQLLARAWRLVAQVEAKRALASDGLQACQRALEYARLAGDERLQAKITQLNLYVLYWSPASLDEVDREAERSVTEARNRGLYSLEAGSLGVRARIAALRGQFEEARQLLQQASGILPEFPDLLMIGNDVLSEAIVEWAAGDVDRAGKVLERGLEEAQRAVVSSRSQIAHLAALLGRVRLWQDRDSDAEQAVEIARRASVASELGAQARWRQVEALLLARRGMLEQARELVQQAVETALLRTQSPEIQAQALVDQAEVLQRAGDRGQAAKAARQALERYQRRGDRVHEQQVMKFLAQLS